ncbi:MAG TPA: hypothetical protein VFF53_12310, partial [Geobacteraceae bacterium]|nr:hypothetical protein [Geobacteraceae bacterium]
MVMTAQIFSRDRIEEAINELSGKMGLSLVFIDREGNIFPGGDEAYAQDDKHSLNGMFRLQRPVYVNREIVGTLACNVGVEQGEALLNAAVICLETSFRLEKEIEDLSSEIVRVYEELSLIYSLSIKLGSELDINTICQQVVEEISRVLAVQTIAIMLLDEKSGTLSIQYCTGKDRQQMGDVRVNALAEPFAQIF